VKGLTPTPPSEPLKPSTGAAVCDHRNAVRDRSESLSAIDRNHCPHSPESAIYAYLTAVYALVAWWAAEGREIDRTRRALRLQRLKVSEREDPFAAVIRSTTQRRPTSELGANGLALCATLPCTRQILSPRIISSGARAASMNVLLGSPSGDRRGRSTPETGRRGPRSTAGPGKQQQHF
jgi:hypothetical protein